MSATVPERVKPTGVERPPPARASNVRPYRERLALADKLIEETTVKHKDGVSKPQAAAALLVVGAFAPLVIAHPAIRGALFEPLVNALYPASAGLTMAADALYSGWFGALVVTLGGAWGFAFWAVGSSSYAGAFPRRAVYCVMGLLAVLVGALLWLNRPAVADPFAMGVAAWVAVSAGMGVYGASKAWSRSDWHAAVNGGIALMLGGRVISGVLAIALLAWSDKEFPGQRVALYSWRRSQVSINPLPQERPAEYAEADWAALRRGRGFWGFAPWLSGALMLVGAFAPIVYAPPLREALFGPLVAAAVSVFPPAGMLVTVSDLFWTLNPLAVAYVAVTSAAAIWGARFAFAKKRPSAVIGGGVLLLFGGRLITGSLVLVLMLLSSQFYNMPAEPAHAPATHDENPAAH